MPLSGPLPPLLDEALIEIYEDFPDPDNPPLMIHLVKAIEKIMADKGYSQETMADIKTALEVRLSILTRLSIGNIFQCKENYPAIKDIMSGYTVLELDRLGEDSKCLCTLFLLNAIREHLKIASPVPRHPRLVIVIEEAHNVVGNGDSADPSSDVVNAQAHSAALIETMLAELRALGVAIIIADQHITDLSPGVHKNTTTKLFFRQNNANDRETISNALLLSEIEKEDIGRLSPGFAYFITEGDYRARKIRTPHFQSKYKLDEAVAHFNILRFIQDEPWYQTNHTKRITEELNTLHQELNVFEKYRISMLERFNALMNQLCAIKSPDRQVLRKSIHIAELHRKNHQYRSKDFNRNRFANLICPKSYADLLHDSNISEFAAILSDRFMHKIRPNILRDLEVMDNFVNQCKSIWHQ